jgi:outer membrane immunogenic protein
MVLRRGFALTLLGVAATLGSAQAADMPVKARPIIAPAIYNWTGFYVGGNVGYGWAHDPVDYASGGLVRERIFRSFGLPAETLVSDITSPLGTIFGSGRAEIDGWLAGGQIGFNRQVGATWVWGFEADFQWTDQHGGITFCDVAGCPVGSLTAIADYEISWFGTVRARAGWLFHPRVLGYVTGGLAYGEIHTDFSTGLVGFPLTTIGSSTTRLGWTVGGGVEGAISDRWTVKLEYLFMDLGDVSGPLAASTTTTIFPGVPQVGFTTVVDTTILQTASTRIHDHILRLGLNYRFSP